MSDRDEQIPTRGISTKAIMSSPEFELGFSDARRGIPFDWRNTSWGYERGRLLAFVAPVDMPLRFGSKLNPKAVALCDAALRRKLIV